jgi:hypothetical protein
MIESPKVPACPADSSAAVVDGRNVDPPSDLDPNAIVVVVRAHLAELRRCYQAALTSDPALAVQTKFRWMIEPGGTVSDLCMSASSVGAPTSMVNCLAGRIQGWRFPALRGEPVEVEFPFVFQSR